MRGIRWALLLSAMVLLPATAQASIIYNHGADLWAMNDDGSGAHALVNAYGFPGAGLWTIGDPDVLPGGNTIVFTGTTDAHNVGTSGPAGACGLVCSGTYRLQNGSLARLSPPPVACGAAQQWCTSYETEPRLTADGQVIYDYFLATWEYGGDPCCYWTFNPGSIHEMDTRTVATGAGPTKWTSSTANGDSPSTDFNAAPDPANASLVAYVENGPLSCTQNCYDVHVGNRNGSSDSTVVYDDAPFVSLAWVPDGSAIIDVEAGQQPGIWVYAPSPATTPGKNFIWLLSDPKPYDPGNPFTTSIKTARYMGSDKILFDQNGDLYTIPLTACAQAFKSPSAPGCTMANAHRLTTSGTNGHAVWTTASFAPPPPPPPKKHCIVPKLSGLTTGQARTRLGNAHCALGTQHRAYSKRVRRGHIISQGKKAGTVMAAGSRIGVTISKGKKRKHRRRHH